MKLVIISGSPRDNSNSLRLAHAFANASTTQQAFSEIEVVDLNKAHIPFLDSSSKEPLPKWESLHQATEQCRSADALMIITPEWHGMCPSALMNFLQLCTIEDLGHRPCLIVTVSTGMGGSNPVGQLRSYGYKNNHICFLPDHLIIRDAGHQFTDEQDLDKNDDPLYQRSRYSLALLKQYSVGLKLVRDSGVVQYEQFRNGMS